MRKLTTVLLAVIMLLCSIVPAYAWTSSDITIYGGEEIIVPLQVPDIKMESAFSIDDSVADHNGEFGNVYKGTVDVSKEQAKTKLFTFNNYVFNEGKYKLSMWFMEDENNSDILTRMIRPLTNFNDTGTTLKADNGGYLLFFNSAGEKVVENGEVVGVTYRADKEIRGIWKKYEMEFTVSSSQNTSWLGKPNVVFSWECVGKYEDAGKKYSDKFINGDINILFSDVKLFKYPSEGFDFVSHNGGETANSFKADFTAPIDIKAIKNVTINGAEKSLDVLDIKSQDNSILLTPKGGFAPGKEYSVSISGITDIFERKYDGDISGVINVPDYLTVDYRGNEEGKNAFSVTNNMDDDANLMIAVFYYSGNSIKKVSYSDATVVNPGQQVDVFADIPDGVQGLSAKAHIWNASMLPMPLAEEIVLP